MFARCLLDRVNGLLDSGVAGLNTASFKTRVIVKERSRTRLDCQYENAQRTEWYLDRSLVTQSHK